MTTTKPPAWHTLAAQIEADLRADIAAYAQEVSDTVERSFTMGRIRASVMLTLAGLEFQTDTYEAGLSLTPYTHLA